jgi:hypothetical protein
LMTFVCNRVAKERARVLLICPWVLLLCVLMLFRSYRYRGRILFDFAFGPPPPPPPLN